MGISLYLFTGLLSDKNVHEEKLKHYEALVDSRLNFYEFQELFTAIATFLMRNSSFPSLDYLKASLEGSEVLNPIVNNSAIVPIPLTELTSLLSIERKLQDKMDFNTLLNTTSSVLVSQGLESARSFILENLYKGNIATKKVVPIQEYSVMNLYKEEGTTPKGLLFYMQGLDETLGVLLKGYLITIAGWTSSYKSTFMLNVAYANAVRLGYSGVIYSVEMSKKDLKWKLLLRHAMHPKFASKYVKVDNFEIKMHRLNQLQLDFLREVEEDLLIGDYGKIYVLEYSDLLNEDFVSSSAFSKGNNAVKGKQDQQKDEKELLESKLFTLDQSTPGGIDFFIIDYLQLIAKGSVNTGSIIDTWMKWAKHMCLNFAGKGLVGFVLSQTNREGWKRAVLAKGKYDLASLAEGNELERSSDIVIPLFSDENLVNENRLYVQALKNRHGPKIETPISIPCYPANCYIGDPLQSEVSAESFFDLI